MDVLEAKAPETVGTAPHQFRRRIASADIQQTVRRLAAELRRDYHGKKPILIGVLNGCFIFMADLIREMNIPCEVDFVKLSSYGDSMSPGALSLLKDVDADLRGRHVIIVEDIVDTGKSLTYLRQHLQSKGPASLVMVTMFLKEIRRPDQAAAEYVGMRIPDTFVVGYGLDYAQQWRQLPDLYVLDEGQ
jgi:hypoxanthine phosphoribosyltransferase